MPSHLNSAETYHGHPSSYTLIEIIETHAATGFVETTHDALILFQSTRQGLLSRIDRRLTDAEKKALRSGSIYIYDEHESNIKRWTDGRLWSPSRILGNFLVYREVEKKFPKSKSPSVARYKQCKDLHIDGKKAATGSKGTYIFKEGGFIKKTISVTLNGSTVHLVSYFIKDDVVRRRLTPPRSDPSLASLSIPSDLLRNKNFRKPPVRVPSLSPAGLQEYIPAIGWNDEDSTGQSTTSDALLRLLEDSDDMSLPLVDDTDSPSCFTSSSTHVPSPMTTVPLVSMDGYTIDPQQLLVPPPFGLSPPGLFASTWLSTSFPQDPAFAHMRNTSYNSWTTTNTAETHETLFSTLSSETLLDLMGGDDVDPTGYLPGLPGIEGKDTLRSTDGPVEPMTDIMAWLRDDLLEDTEATWFESDMLEDGAASLKPLPETTQQDLGTDNLDYGFFWSVQV